MGCKWYLAMTNAEFAAFSGEDAVAWMSCRFSAVHSGLGNLPEVSPALVILDDFIPFARHDPRRIARELTDLQPEGILLDFQRQWNVTPVVDAILSDASCPVAITEPYARQDCGVLICPDLNIPLAQAVKPWLGRDVWLDVAVGMQTFTVTEQGCAVSGITEPTGQFPLTDAACHCRYRREDGQDHIRFSLYRSPESLGDILKAAEDARIQKAIGLYRDFLPSSGKES